MKYHILIVLFFIVTAYGCNNSKAEPAPETSITKTADVKTAQAAISLPSFKIIDLKGRAFNLADFRGKKIFVNLWASWCPPCRAEIPSIEKLYGKIDKNKAAFVMLSLDNDFATAALFATNNKLTTPVYYPAENLPALFNVQGIPATFIFDEKGNLIKRMDGGDDYNTSAYLSLFTK
jgi:thiol-disulfide isomerase/thioredoxin